jgi:uncharacterized iron-regulated membrane protein
MDLKFLLPYLQIAHGLFNLSLFAAFVYQGWLGWLIRRNRRRHIQDFARARSHRSFGPLLAGLLPVGYLSGLLFSYLHHDVWTRYPLHLTTGTLLVAAVTSTWLISRQIRGGRSSWRTTHSVIGLVILMIFSYQIFLGMNVLL